MNEVSSDAAADLWSEQWAIQAEVKARTIEYQMAVSQAGKTPAPRQQAAEKAIRDLLAVTDESIRRRGRLSRRGPLDRWRGTAVERAFQSLHAAEIFLVDLLPDEELNALVPKVLARADAVLERGDPRRHVIDQLPGLPAGPTKRAALQAGMTIAYDASDHLHVRVRDFRNILLASAALITLLMTVLTLVVALFPQAMPLCFSPSSTGPTAPDGAVTVCPSGDHQPPSGGDVAIVAGLGLLGGALAAAFAIRNIRGTSTPYGVPISLAALKVPSGALTAVAGILLLGGNFVPGLSELDTQRQILAYALVLGYAQQLATRLIDNRAQSLLDSVPSKDPEAKQPTPPLTVPPPAAPPLPAPRARYDARRESVSRVPGSPTEEPVSVPAGTPG